MTGVEGEGEPMSLDALFAELRSETIEDARERSESAFHRIAAPFEDRIVVFGTGYLGNVAYAGLRNAGIEPIAFCDNNPGSWGSRQDGIEVMSPGEAVKRYGGSAAFVVAIYNSTTPRRQLMELGCTPIVPYPVLFWKHWRSMPREDRLELPHRILARLDEMPGGYDLLYDEQSRREFRAQIRWRCLLDYDCLPAAGDPREMYFPPDLFSLIPREIFVDCGAFDGDSIQTFLEKTSGRFGKIYAWEADPENLRALYNFRERLLPAVAERVEILPYAVGEREQRLRFCAEGSVGSRVVDAADGQEVECKTIDGVLKEFAPTFVKMDIEGAEPAALCGAMQTMAQCRPVMAVCAYHSCDHLWKIPQLLKSANPDYRIVLRRYAEDCWETVYYAIPPERFRPDE